jgi:hypothetical protein
MADKIHPYTAKGKYFLIWIYVQHGMVHKWQTLTSPDLNNKGPLAKQKVVGSKGGLAALATQYEAKYEISADMVPRR